jgi:hypothetical protein
MQLLFKNITQFHLRTGKIFFASDEHINLDGAQAVHLWNEQLRRDNLDKNTVFDKESLYERLISDLKLDE